MSGKNEKEAEGKRRRERTGKKKKIEGREGESGADRRSREKRKDDEKSCLFEDETVCP